MFSLEMKVEDDAADYLAAELWELGSTGIVETDLPGGMRLLRAFFDPEDDADALLDRFAAFSPRLERHAPRDWVAVSQQDWTPLPVGERFYLVPEWRDDAAPPGRLRIAINPGLACGTGYHEATQLCLEAIEAYQTPHATVLDVGAGAGILSIAAALLGAGRVIACDVDGVAVEIAAAAFRRAEARVLLFTGSVDSVRSGSADLIVANISAAAAIELAPEVLRSLAPGGRWIASGFEIAESAAVEAALARAGAVIDRKTVKGQWIALVGSHRDHAPHGGGHRSR
jgi:ribosomal protein L11 methyltransferase